MLEKAMVEGTNYVCMTIFLQVGTNFNCKRIANWAVESPVVSTFHLISRHEQTEPSDVIAPGG